MDGGWWMNLGLADLSSFISHHIPADILKPHKSERCHDYVPTWLCPLKKKKKEVLLFQEDFLQEIQASGKTRKRCVRKKSFPRCSTNVKSKSCVIFLTLCQPPGKPSIPGGKSRRTSCWVGSISKHGMPSRDKGCESNPVALWLDPAEGSRETVWTHSNSSNHSYTSRWDSLCASHSTENLIHNLL